MSRPVGLTEGEWLFVYRLLLGEKRVDAVAFAFPKIAKQERRHEYAKKLLARPAVAATIDRLRAQFEDRAKAGVEAIDAKLLTMFEAAPIKGADAVKVAKLMLERVSGGLQPRNVKVSGTLGLSFADLVLAAQRKREDEEPPKG